MNNTLIVALLFLTAVLAFTAGHINGYQLGVNDQFITDMHTITLSR